MAEFVDRVVAATADRIRLGDPLDPLTTMGPLNNEANASKFDAHVAEAVGAGAVVCCGGKRARGHPTQLFAEPTVLHGVTDDMLIAREETFGPVVPVIEISSDSRALELTNGSPFGLTAAVFTEDLERGLAFAEAGACGLGEHQRLDEPLGVAPSFWWAVRKPERPRTRRRQLAVRRLHRTEDDSFPGTAHLNTRPADRPPTSNAGQTGFRGEHRH